jgi:hypothetical protein
MEIAKTDGDPGIARQRKAYPPTVVAGAPGTAVFGGFIEERERDRTLIGHKKYDTYSNMLANVSIVAAGVRYFLNLVAKPGWKFEPKEGGGALAEKYAELLTDMSSDMETPWRRVIRRAAMYRFYGFSIQEWTAKRRDDGAIGLLDIAPRPQHTIEKWDVEPTGKVLGVVQRSPIDYKEVYLPRAKTIYVVDDSLNDSPEGLGLFRHLAEPCRRLGLYEQLEGYGFESDLRGIPLARAPLTALDQLVKNGEITEAQKLAIIAPLTEFMENHIRNPKLGLLLDSMTYESQDERQQASTAKQWDMELLKATSSTQGEIARTIDRLNREIARVLGVEQLLLGDNGVGSFAMAKEKAHNFALIIDSTLGELIESIFDDYVTRIFILNGWDLKLRPTVKTDKLQYRSIEEVTASLEQMARAGAVLAPDDPAIGEVRDLMGLSRPITVLSELELQLRAQDHSEEMAERGMENEEKATEQAANQPAPAPASGTQPGAPKPKPASPK